MTLSDDGFKEVLNVVCTPSGKHSVGCNYGSAPDSLSVCNLAPDDPYLLQFLWECLNILPMDSLRSEEMKNERRFLFCSFFSRWTDWYTSGCLSDQSKIYYYRAERKSGSTMVSHFCCARGSLFGKNWKPFLKICRISKWNGSAHHWEAAMQHSWR